MISIIIPTYNEARVIGERLAMLKKGLTLPHEIVVTDDKSTDGTVEIARRYADKVVEHAAKTRSIAANRNDGARAASGDILVFMDADSVLGDPDAFIKKAHDDLERHAGTVAVTARVDIFPAMRTVGDRIVYFFMDKILRFKNNVIHVGEAQGKFQMMRKADFERVGGFNENLVTREDADMFQRLAKIGRTYYDHSLVVLHSGRRAHQLGWPKLLSVWMLESFHVAVFSRSRSKEWKDVR